MKHILTTLLLLFSLTISAQTVDVVGPKKKQQATAQAKPKQQVTQPKQQVNAPKQDVVARPKHQVSAKQKCDICQKQIAACQYKGDHPAKELYEEGVKYYNGNGVAQNYYEAVNFFRKAAEQGNADAQVDLGFCYGMGYGVSQDHSEEVKWYRKAADQGHVIGQANLGSNYLQGNGVTRDYAEGFKWCLKAAEQGNAIAQGNVGWCYSNGNGVTKNYSEAVKWFRKAAEQGNAYSQYNLGWCYEYGQGVTQDVTEANTWYQKAAVQGYEAAKEKLNQLEQARQEQLRRERQKINGHEYVDLGLPSGTKWATCNVGAIFPEQEGEYYAWGETIPQKTPWDHMGWKGYLGGKINDYKSCGKKNDPLANYVNNKVSIAGTQYDVAHVKWGGSWKMPTESQFDELKNEWYCKWTWTKQNGVNGYKIVSKLNGNSIFLPATGDPWVRGTFGTVGRYWSATPLSVSAASDIYFYESTYRSGGSNRIRCIALTVRPVSE